MTPGMSSAKKPSFIDDVVDEMGDGKGGSDYGADMEDDGADDESAQEDRQMATRQVAKALGMPNADIPKLTSALEAFVKTCM